MKSAIVITSINPPTKGVREIAKGLQQYGASLIVIGDEKSPEVYDADGVRFFSIQKQRDTEFAFARICPTRHYARKNIGYLIAISEHAPTIIETDDDNIPMEGFWFPREAETDAALLSNVGWANIYQYYSDAVIWPRGLPLDEINKALPSFDNLPTTRTRCPIQQGLADENPDVDAIYRLILPLPINFRKERRVALGEGTWCPFNSQNTTWWPEAYPLLYLPFHCSFRMTDIWRSFVAQRIGQANGWTILFHESTVYQERNEHNLMKDFADEIVGYLNNRTICERLGALDLLPGAENIPENMRRCYRTLIELNMIGAEEIPLLNAWLADISAIIG